MSGSSGSRITLLQRALVSLQVFLLVATMVTPVAALAYEPYSEPSAPPSAEPSAEPTAEPSVDPTAAPTAEPTAEPTAAPTAEPTAAPTRAYVVSFVAGTASAEQTAAVVASGATTTDTIGVLRIHAVTASDASVALLRANALVGTVELDRSRAVEATPDDASYVDQWALPIIGWDQAYGTVDPAGSAVVAILDTGVDAFHPDLDGNIVSGASFVAGSSWSSDPNGHGTSMAGIVAAETNNGSGIAGVGYDGVSVMPITVLGADGLGRDSDIVEGLVWAADHGADVALMAFSASGYSSALQAAVDYAWSKGVVLVAAAGNDGSSTSAFPAGDAGVIGVSSTTAGDTLAAGSNVGAAVFLGAPGSGILTTGSGASTYISGTSAAAAHVAGAAGLLAAVDPSASNGSIVGRLARNADPVGTAAETGNGRLNLARALADTATEAVKPAGAAPIGDGGPFVGPYVAAQTNFQSLSVSAQSPSSVPAGSPATFTISIGMSGAGSCTVGSFVVATVLPTGVTASFSPTSVTRTSTGTATTTLTLSTSASTPAATTSFTVGATGTAGDCNNSRTGNGSLVVAAAADNVRPSVTLSSGAPDPTNGTIAVTAQFSEIVTGFVVGDISVTNGTAGSFSAVDGDTYTFVVTATADGLVSISVPANVAQDAATNLNTASDTLTRTFDNVRPTVVSVTRDDASPTKGSSVAVTVTFSEPVEGVDATDFELTTTGTIASASVTSVTGSDATYTVSIGTGSGDGSIRLDVLDDDTIADVAGNPLDGGFTTGQTYELDRTLPTSAITFPVDDGVYNDDAFDAGCTTDGICGSADDALTGGVASGVDTVELAVKQVASGLYWDGTSFTSATVVYQLATGTTTWSLAFPATNFPDEGDYIVVSRATDEVGNAEFEALLFTVDFEIDRTAPDVTITSAVADPTNDSPIGVTIQFTEPVTGFTLADLVVGNGTAANFIAVDGDTYTADITPTADGLVTVDLAAGVAQDAATNGNTAAATFSITYDTTIAVAITSVTDPVNAANQASVGASGTTDQDDNTVTVTITDSGTGSSGPITATVSGGTWSVAGVDISSLDDGAITYTVDASDAAGNTDDDSRSATKDTVLPDVTIDQATGQADPTNVAAIAFTAVFSEPVSGFTTSDVDLAGSGTASVTSVTDTGDGMTFDIVVTATLDGTITTSIAADAVSDAAGNGNATSTSIDGTVTYDTTAPTGSLTIDSNATYTNTTSVTLNLGAADLNGIVSYRFADGTDCTTASFVAPFTAVSPYSANISHTLPAGDGTKTVCVQYKDAAGNLSTTATDTIILDQTLPIITITDPDHGANYTALTWNGGCSTTFVGDLCGTSSDALSGVATVRYSIQRASDLKYWNGTSFSSATEVHLTPTGLASWTQAFAYGSFPATGQYTLRARATDSAGNSNTAVSTFTINNPSGGMYVFEGFYQPVDNVLLNKANAGSTIPVKWRITLNGVAVSDPNSFVALTSRLVDCGTLAGLAVDDIETYTTNSGLQYTGNGTWHFNWKTPKTYANQCRVMTVTLNDGSTHDADFQFK